MTTLQPRPPYGDEELSQLYPKNLELRKVQILLRHGERTPVNARFQNAGLHQYWPYCEAAKQVRSNILDGDGSWDTLTWKRKLETLGSNDTPLTCTGTRGEPEGICKPGELTDRGRQTTLALGQRIRKLYIDQLNFLQPFMDDQARSEVKLRATPIPRALESVQQAFIGLYPAGQRAPGLLAPTITQRLMQDETLVPNEVSCKRFAELTTAFAARTAQLWNDSAEMRYLNQKLGRWMPAATPKVQVDGHPRLSGILDTTNATLAHGPNTRLPPEFYDSKVLAHTDRVCTEEWFVGYQESAEYRRLGIGGLIGDLAQHMVEHVRSDSNNNSSGTKTPTSSAVSDAHATNATFKMSLSGCHDTTIAATLAALGAFRVDRDPWPSFTSSIAIELFRATSPQSSSPDPSSPASSPARWPSKERSWWYALFSPSSSSSSLPDNASSAARQPLAQWSARDQRALDAHFVRIRYNDVPVTLPFCRPEGRHLDGDASFCTLAAFKQAADLLTPADWRAECSANLGTSAFPETLEPPPGVRLEEV